MLLLFFYPIGLILMWFWMVKWPLWLKILLSLPVALALFAFFAALIFAAIFVRNIGWQQQMNIQREKMMQQWLSPTPTNTRQAQSPSSAPANNSFTY